MSTRFAVGFLWAFALAAGLMLAAPAAAQDATAQDATATDTTATDTTVADTTVADSLQRRPAPPSDTTRASRADSISVDSTAAPASSGATPGSKAPAEAVKFSARDSLIVDLDEEEGDVGTLYGEAKVTRKEIKLNAYQVDILLDQNELHATGLPVDTGTVGLPHFQRGEEDSFTGRTLAFNLNTERGRVVEARTGYESGFVEGEVVKTYSDSVQFIQDGQYSTCHCARGETPSYSLRSNKMKVQGKWVYTGPIELFIFNIPTPLLLPFSFLPNTAGRHSGLLPPTYGDDQERGFFLKNLGYYWAINDYVDLQVSGGLWSRGSWQVRPVLQYEKRYRYGGRLEVNYVRNIIGDVVDRGYVNSTEASIKWNHHQKFNPTTRLSGNVDLASSSYRRGISENYDDRVTQQVTSSINFSKRWAEGARNFDVSLRQRQNFGQKPSDQTVSLTLPNLSFSQQRFKPFEREQRGPGEGERWYERITFQYDGDLSNRYTFRPLSNRELRERQNVPDSVSADSLVHPDISWFEGLLSPSKYERATGQERRFDFSASHHIPVRASFSLDRYQLNVTPNFDYNEDWFINTRRKEVRIDTLRANDTGMGSGTVNPSAIIVDTSVVERNEPGFFAARDFSFGVSANTTFYGLFPFRLGPLKDLRHTVRPSLSLNYAPNVYSNLFGRTRTYRDPDTGERVRYDITDGNEVRRSTAQRSLNFSVDNTFETKHVRIDSTGAEQTETLQLLRLGASSSYNFAADSMGLSDIRIDMRSPALRRFDINANASFTFSPYAYENNQRINRLVISEPGLRLARLTQFNFSVNTSFEGGQDDREAGPSSSFPQGTGFGSGGSSFGGSSFGGSSFGGSSFGTASGGYADFSIPWSLDLDFSYRLNNGASFSTRAILNANFSFNLTPNWKVSGVSGYDFTAGELSTTDLTIQRNLGCWQMDFGWTPFGRYQSYSFSLHVTSGALSDLLNLRLPRSGVKDRFKNLIPTQR